MASGFTAPRIRAKDPFANKDGTPTSGFVRFWDTFCKGLERQESSQAEVLAQLAQVQAQQAQQLELIYQALELAGIAIEMSGAGGATGAATTVLNVTDVGWTAGPQVDLTGVVAGTLVIPSTGLSVTPTITTSSQGEIQGRLRLVEIVSGVDTVVGGPWTFTATRYDANFASHNIYLGNPAAIPVFSTSRSTTGAVGYRLDAQMDTGETLTDVSAKLYVKRSP